MVARCNLCTSMFLMHANDCSDATCYYRPVPPEHSFIVFWFSTSELEYRVYPDSVQYMCLLLNIQLEKHTRLPVWYAVGLFPSENSINVCMG
ncbi:hypothetical protein VNO77_38954 [Canavalia gladiata]|uniref:Uncharacterized protein n=1 Tax=Canavalia gladiata TaxID=3824 RepID=A0AAN9KBS8_CANGL